MNHLVKRPIQAGAIALLALVSAPALAHVGHAEDIAASFTSGLAHPFGGWDHLLAMATVGAWGFAALRAGRRWLAPLAFVAALLLGGLLPTVGLHLPGAEAAIALSVLLLGAMWLAGARVPVSAGLALIALAGIFHGYAHGAEMAQGARFAGYASGFMLGSALLHGLGWLAGLSLTRLPALFKQACAALVATAGLAMLATRL